MVVEGEYRLPHQGQAYIETNGAAAGFEPDGTLVALGTLQCPHYVQKALNRSWMCRGAVPAAGRAVSSAEGVLRP